MGVIVFYGDTCSHCQEIHPQQEKAAEKILKKTSNIKFGRIDQWREGEAKLYKKFPDFDVGGIPKAFFVSGENDDPLQRNITQIHHGALGWKSHTDLYEWIKHNT